MTSGCTAAFKNYPYSMVNSAVSLEPLKREEYTVLGDVEGRAEGSCFLWACSVEGGPKFFSGTLVQGLQAEMVAPSMGPIGQAALYNAMEAQPDADGIIAVRVIKGEVTNMIIFSKETIIIKGKAIKIKKD